MKLSYEDLISGDNIYFEGVGYLRPPKVSDLKPTSGIGVWTYNLYISLMSWNKEAFLKHLRALTNKKFKALENEKIAIYDAMTLVVDHRALLRDAIAFFLCENVEWDDEKRCFVIFDAKTKETIGIINKQNFDEFRDVVLQMNYINVGKEAKPIKHSSTASQELWERAQQYLKKESVKMPKDKKYTFGNIISKLCAAQTGYTLFNIYDLTIFQLYDQFFQYGYLRIMDLNEMAFSNHGGENFEMEAWLEPLLNN